MDDKLSAEGLGFCDARQAGDLLFCSGQIGLAPDGTVHVRPEDQFVAAFDALSAVLARHGSSLADVVDLTTFHVGYPGHMDTFMAALSEALPGDKPAWTAIGVAALGFPASLVEIKAIARVPAENRAEASDAAA